MTKELEVVVRRRELRSLLFCQVWPYGDDGATPAGVCYRWLRYAGLPALRPGERIRVVVRITPKKRRKAEG